MPHTAKNYDHLIGNLPGLSEKQLRAHFELYQGYVKKFAEIEEKLKKADPKTANYSYGEISELMRRRSVAHNGAYLHEIYFENLTHQKSEPSSELRSAIEKDFGSMEQWFAQAKAGLISEPGWVLLTRSRIDGSLRNDLLKEHHVGLFVEQDILLALDAWEHAYMIDYSIKKADYAATLEKLIHWNVASLRFQSSVNRHQAAA